MRVLDIDLDFFLNKVPAWPTEDRLDDDYVPWSEAEVRRFLEERCGLSRERPVRGRYVTRHHEALFFWRDLIEAGRLEVPFEVVHVDSHADLGMGDAGYVYIMTDLLSQEVERRVALSVGSEKLVEGNYLAFALACRWLSRLVYVAHPSLPDDLFHLHFRGFEPATGVIQMKHCTAKQLDVYFSGPGRWPPHTALEPEVPFLRVSRADFSTSEPFDYAVLSHSPRYTPPSADALVPVIMEYIERI